MAKPLLLFGDDNGQCSIYELTLDQYQKIVETEADPNPILDKFRVKIDTAENGYVPDWAAKLAEIYGFETESN